MSTTLVLAISCVLMTAVGAPAAEQVRRMGVSGPADVTPARATVSELSGVVTDDRPAGPDIPQMPGWPRQVPVQGNFKPIRGGLLVDLVGDANLEVLVASTDGRVYAWDYLGNALPGFPVATVGFPQWAPAVGDLDGDGDLEIVQTTRGLSSGGRLYAFDHVGQVLPGFPVNLNNNNVEYSPVLYDLDGDGRLEIVVGERAWPNGYLHVVRMDGTRWGGNWPVTLDHVPAASAAVADIDRDGRPEIVYYSYNSIYVLRTDGTSLPGWPRSINGANFSYQSAALADFDGDGDLELVVGAHQSAAGCYLFQHDGTLMPGWPRLFGTWSYGPPTVADLDGDGALEVIDGRAGVFGGNSAAFWVWSRTGQTWTGFPYMVSHGGGSDGPYTTADIDGDGRLEIFADHNVTVGGLGFVFGVDASGADLSGFPLRPTGFTYMNGATIGDVDRDGDYELCVLGSGDFTLNVYLYDLPQRYRRTRSDWPTYHARYTRDGLYGTGGQPGDMNCDGELNSSDIEGFILALFDPAGYAQRYPDCDINHADMNGDGQINSGDIEGFIAALFGP